jgi:hypothetical protein
MTTDKNKQQFEKWYNVKFRLDLISSINSNNYIVSTSPSIDSFYKLPFEMQIGVYLAYYDSLGIIIDIEADLYNDKNVFLYIWHINSFFEWDCSSHNDIPPFKTRNEAYKEAFKKADELINKQLC